MGNRNNRREPAPVIEHAPRKLFVVHIDYRDGSTRRFEGVRGTVTETRSTPQDKALVPYQDYMIIQQESGESTYVNMVEVKQLSIGEQ